MMVTLSDKTSNILNLCHELNRGKKFYRFLLIAPPAWGKTQLLISALKTWKVEKKKVIYLSPLSALNLEFARQCAEVLEKDLDNPNDIAFSLLHLSAEVEPLKEFLSSSIKQGGLVVMTPERWLRTQSLVNWSDWAELLILDEFHLLDLWNHFRDSLDELFYWLGSELPFHCWFLTATFDEKKLTDPTYENLWAQWLSPGEDFYILKVAQASPISIPVGVYFFNPNSTQLFNWFLKSYILGSFTNKRTLIFVGKRSEVEQWLKWCEYYHLRALGALGGETAKFSESLQKEPNPQVIIATSCLSHGVNLPDIHAVFINHALKEAAFFWQMIGRAGRKKESYEIFAITPSDQELMKNSWIKKFSASKFRFVLRMIKVWLCLWHPKGLR